MRYLVIFSPLLTLVAGLVLGIVYGLQPEPLSKPMNRLTPFDCQRLFKTAANQQLFADALWREFPNDPTVDPQGRTVAKRIDLLTRDGRWMAHFTWDDGSESIVSDGSRRRQRWEVWLADLREELGYP